MKIVFVVNALKNGGAERVCAELASYFSKSNEVYILVTSAKSEHIYDTGKSKIEYLKNGKRVLPLFKTRLCYKWMKRNKPDIVVAFPDPCSYYGAVAAKKLKIPCVCSERNAPMFQPKSKIMRIMRLIAYYQANAIVFQTNEAMGWFPDRIKRKGVVIWNPYESPKIFAHNSEVESIDGIVTAGRIVHQKNQILLIETFKNFNLKFPKTCLHIFGDGSPAEIQKLRDKISSLKLDGKVVLKGFSNNLKQELVKYPVFVLSSNHEGMPNALLEAAIAGLTCVSTDCPAGGPKELLIDCNAHYLVPCEEPDKLLHAMITAYENRKRDRDSIKEYSLELAKRVSIERIANEWLHVFKKCLVDDKK